MSCNFWDIDRRISFKSTLVLPFCLALSACGGGGASHVASVPPPPPTPTPTPQGTIDVQTAWLDSPATRNGNYSVIGGLTLTPGNGNATSYRLAAPGELQMRVSRYFDDDPTNYFLDAPAGLLPGGLTSIGVTADIDSWDFNYGGPNYRYDNPYGDYAQYLGQNLKEYEVAPDGTRTLRINYDYSRGVSANTQPLTSSTSLATSLLYDIGFSYVAMGEWSWRVVDLNGTAAGDFGDLLFVNGDRTPSAGIPVSGTATYDAHTLALLSSSGDAGIPFTLTADFAQRTMSTAIDQNYLYDPSSSTTVPILGIHVGGSAPFNNNGTFDIPLTGTVNYAHTPQPVTPLPEPVTGTMDGAFFGPHAEQVGGVFALQRPDQTVLVQDAFAGQKRGP
jgi:hypothetical protein